MKVMPALLPGNPIGVKRLKGSFVIQSTIDYRECAFWHACIYDLHDDCPPRLSRRILRPVSLKIPLVVFLLESHRSSPVIRAKSVPSVLPSKFPDLQKFLPG
jgi:hypothetical protein